MDTPTPTPAASVATPAPVKASKRRAPSRKPASANDMAARLSKAHGHTVTAKSVRQWVRDNVTKYQDDRYTVHEYDAALQRRIEDAWKARTARRTASRKADGR